jgi:hypothetical protein
MIIFAKIFLAAALGLICEDVRERYGIRWALVLFAIGALALSVTVISINWS